MHFEFDLLIIVPKFKKRNEKLVLNIYIFYVDLKYVTDYIEYKYEDVLCF